jgi:sulfatase maturation enzyme AslB (radical SAM superfamily)
MTTGLARGSDPAKLSFLMNDFIVSPDVCNFACDYCIFTDAPEWAGSQGVGYGAGNSRPATVYAKDRDNVSAFLDVESTLNHLRSAFATPILRICGGELLYLKNSLNLIERIHESFETVQLITNGYFLDSSARARLAALGNVVLHVSMDGHTAELNHLRTRNPRVHARLMDNVLGAMDAGLSVEVATCLTTQNMEGYAATVEFFSRQRGRVLLLPFPVRGEGAARFVPVPGQVPVLKAALDGLSKDAARMLPPRPYLERLFEFMAGGLRTQRCRIAQAIVQTFADGNVAGCSMDWSVLMGSIRSEEDGDTVKDRMSGHPAYRLYFADRPRMPACRTCFTVSEIINLYVDGLITESELQAMDLYGGARSMMFLRELKAANAGRTT